MAVKKNNVPSEVFQDEAKEIQGKEEMQAKGEQEMVSSQMDAKYAPFKVTAKISSLCDDPNSAIRGYASITINDMFAVRGVKVVNGTSGLFVSMPNYKAGDEFKDICFPVTKEGRAAITEAVKEAYQNALVAQQNGMNEDGGAVFENTIPNNGQNMN